MARWLLVLVICGCGRVGFAPGAAEDVPASPDAVASPDAAADGAAPDAGRAALMATAFAHWKFDDGAGTTALDATGNGLLARVLS